MDPLKHSKLRTAVAFHTFLLGECITGAGGDGGPRGIFLLILNNYENNYNYNQHVAQKYTSESSICHEQAVNTYLNLGGSIGSFCISTIRITLCFAPELNATPC